MPSTEVSLLADIFVELGGTAPATTEVPLLQQILAQIRSNGSHLDAIEMYSGWAEYQDTQYTSESPFSLAADQDTILPNNAGVTRDGQKPIDIETFYDAGTQKITGRDGDGVLITVEFDAVTSTALGAYIELWYNIGGTVGELYRGVMTTFPKGNNIAVGCVRSIGTFTLDTWAANGASVYVRSSEDCSISNIRYVLTRTHKARSS